MAVFAVGRGRAAEVGSLFMALPGATLEDLSIPTRPAFLDRASSDHLLGAVVARELGTVSFLVKAGAERILRFEAEGESSGAAFLFTASFRFSYSTTWFPR